MRKRAAGTGLRSRMPQLTFAAKKETRDSLAAHLTVSLELFCANNWVKYVNYTLCPLFHISKIVYLLPNPYASIKDVTHGQLTKQFDSHLAEL